MQLPFSSAPSRPWPKVGSIQINRRVGVSVAISPEAQSWRSGARVGGVKRVAFGDARAQRLVGLGAAQQSVSSRSVGLVGEVPR